MSIKCFFLFFLLFEIDGVEHSLDASNSEVHALDVDATSKDEPLLGLTGNKLQQISVRLRSY